MHMHINRCRKDKEAMAVDNPVGRNAGTGMADTPVRQGDIGNPPVRKTDVLQDKAWA